ncbi:MAG: PQQ-dependent sugar dehydrogenase, partial [Planctomycetota bacterium]
MRRLELNADDGESRLATQGRTWAAVRTTVAGLGLLFAARAAADIPTGDITIRLEPVAAGLTAPVSVTHAGDGSGRLFIVEQSGQIRIVENGNVLPTPFLDLSGEIPALNPFFDERGVLGLAFHPDYANNGRFFVRYGLPRAGDPSEPCFGSSRGCHEEVVAEFSVSGDPNVADPNGTILFRIDEPQFNHDSGDVAFGPDGFLYFTLGDGGGAHDGLADTPPSHGPIGHGQNIETALGSILRIDVDSPPQVPLEYAIPPDNPFVGTNGVDEIYAYGMRNPYKFSFDDGPGGDGSLYLADVGQNLFEEVNIVVNGGNYGWVIREGFHCFDPFNPLDPPAACPSTGPLGEPLLDPIAEYSHPGSGFVPEGGITVIGGFVYRGWRSPGLAGTYVFGDFAQQFVVPSGSLFFLQEPTPGDFEIRQFQIGPEDRPYGLFLKGFGEGEDGEVYTCGSTALAPFGDSGLVERIVALPDPALDIKPGSCPNSVNRGSRGVVPVGLLGTAGFDVSTVDLASVRLSRADGIGGSVAPHEGPPGPHSVIADVGTPFDGETCDCHDLSGDGIDDLSMKFRTADLVAALELDLLPAGALVELTVSGSLLGSNGSGTAIFNFGLDGDQEVPPTGSPGTGSCTVILDESSGDVTVSCTYEGLVGTTFAAHIHGLAPPGINAAV